MQSSELVSKQADFLLHGETNAHELRCLSQEFGPLSIDEAYAIQFEGLKLRQRLGKHLAGWKMGLTSIAKRQQMSLDAAIFGYLLSEKLIKEDSFSISQLIHPKIEPEIGFRIRKPIDRAMTVTEISDLVESYCPALEIIDSRYIGFKYFSLPDVVADNCSAAHYVWGQEKKFHRDCILDQLSMTLLVNGEAKESALSSEISGHPLQSLVQLSELLEKYQLSAAAGSYILAGSATTALPIQKGDLVTLKVDSLETLCLKIL